MAIMQTSAETATDAQADDSPTDGCETLAIPESPQGHGYHLPMRQDRPRSTSNDSEPLSPSSRLRSLRYLSSDKQELPHKPSSVWTDSTAVPISTQPSRDFAEQACVARGDSPLLPELSEKGKSSATQVHTTVASPRHKQEHEQPRLWHRREDGKRAALRRKLQAIELKMPPIFHGADSLEKARLRMRVKNEIIAACGEFVGTFLFLFFALGIATIASGSYQRRVLLPAVSSTVPNFSYPPPPPDPAQLLYTALGFGFALAVNVWAFFRISGGLFNPALCLALVLTRSITWYRAVVIVIAEFVAAILASAVLNLILPGGLNARTTIAPDMLLSHAFTIELILTAQLTMVVFMLAIERHKSTHLASVGIGLSLFISALFAGPLTGASLNPARSLGPDAILGQFDRSCWIYYTAPFAGSLLSTVIYKLFKWLCYETSMGSADKENVHLLMRDKDGKIFGFVDQVDGGESLPSFIQRHLEAQADLEGVQVVYTEEGETTSSTPRRQSRPLSLIDDELKKARRRSNALSIQQAVV